jgi:hypothetical protein
MSGTAGIPEPSGRGGRQVYDCLTWHGCVPSWPDPGKTGGYAGREQLDAVFQEAGEEPPGLVGLLDGEPWPSR